MFLTDEDYDAQIRNEVMAVVSSSAITRQKAELMAQSQMEESLNGRYKVGEIFSATGEDRNPIVMMYMIDLTLYHLHSKSATRMIPKIRLDRFDAAKEWLKLVRGGDLNPDLPLLDEDTAKYFIRLGCNKKRSSDW